MSKNKKNNGGNNNSNREAEARERARQEAEAKEKARKAAEAAAQAARRVAEEKARSSGTIKQGVRSVGNTLNKAEIQNLQNKGYTADQIQKIAGKVDNVKSGAQAVLSGLSGTSTNTSGGGGSVGADRPNSRVVTAAIESLGGKLNKSDIERLQSEGLTRNQIEKVASQAGAIGAGAQRVLDGLRSAGGGATGGGSESGSGGGGGNNRVPVGGGADPNRNPFNPAAATTTYGFSGDAIRLGMSGDFAQGLILPGKNAQLTAAEQEDVRRNIENQFKLYSEQKLTDLRGRISKELAQLYNMTEIGKSKIAAQSAMDTTRETGMQTFRQNVRDNYGRSLMSMW